MSEIVTQLFSDLCCDTPKVVPKSIYHLFKLRRIIAQTSIPMIPEVDPRSFHLIIEDVFQHDGVINWGRILVVYKFAHIYALAYPAQRLNVRIIMRTIMYYTLKRWIVVHHMNIPKSYIGEMFKVLHSSESCDLNPWMF
jgi:hypothetical protein